MPSSAIREHAEPAPSVLDGNPYSELDITTESKFLHPEVEAWTLCSSYVQELHAKAYPGPRTGAREPCAWHCQRRVPGL